MTKTNSEALPKSVYKLLLALPRQAATRTTFDALVRQVNANAKSGDILKDLLNQGKLYQFDLPFPSRKKTIFAPKQTPLEAIVLEIDRHAYLSHGTAARLHGLTKNTSEEVYINIEQSLRSSGDGQLIQENVKRAFSGKGRATTNIVVLGKTRIIQLNGKNTNDLAVKAHRLSAPKKKLVVRMTSLERTLIDITVRPGYCGGSLTVLECYRNAASKADISRLVSILTAIKHIYPYHQSIGYYMQQAGNYPIDQMQLLRDIPRQVHFYLDYALENPTFCEEWQIYVPANLNI